ncbi:ATP-binding protein [Frigidibacter sp. MR17.14]|uniref:ATP-binding protein n=1 Tax=Frigidibacter sp. MR17.14 TaxID=3126509 RepID=UPI003012B18C
MTRAECAPEFLRVESSPVGAEIAAIDWASTPIGPIREWPVSLRSTLAMMLACPLPMFLAWGPDLRSFYNDAYRPILGYRAQGAIGRPFRKLWASIWDDIGPLVDATLAGESRKLTDMRLDISREQVPEESYWTFSYSPAFDDEGRIAGLFCVTGETTDRVLAERRRDEADERLRLAMSAGKGIGTWDWDVPADRVTADARFAHLYGVDPAVAEAGAPIASFFKGIHPDDRDRVQSEVTNAVVEVGAFTSEYRLLRADGSVRWVSAQGHCVPGADGSCARLPGVSFDVTAQKRLEGELRAAKEEREFVINVIGHQRSLRDPEAILRYSSEVLGRRLKVDRVGFYRILGNDRVLHSGGWADSTLSPLIGEQPASGFGPYAESERRAGRTLVFSDARVDADGKLTPYSEADVMAGICVPLMSDGRWAAGIYLHQASARHWSPPEVALASELVLLTWLAIERAEAELRRTQRIDRQNLTLTQRTLELQEESRRRAEAEDALRQLQKMEAVGQLTGGIAHDFNNMLAVIMGGLNLTQRRLARGDTEVGDFIDGAMDGAKRAMLLTQRLLAFARRQPLASEVLDVNRLVKDLSDMLIRSLGDEVSLETVAGPDLWTTKVDPNQLEHAIVNLAVNARDAMVDGGKVTIETANVHVDASYARDADIQAGQYVLVSVSDTGTGMSPEVVRRAFEPFFTTKGVGKGTGLGLSQVFGFARQSGGHVKIYSEPGHGTTIKLYLPRTLDEGVMPTRRHAEAPPLRARDQETVLVVEDEERVRHFTIEAMRELGYITLEAASGPEALAIIEREPQITLLFTDVIMPEMTGRQLADRALQLRPDLRVIFTSGYTRNAMGNDGVIDAGTNFLSKPFALEQLATKLREVLDPV